jgi:hypothetical protein
VIDAVPDLRPNKRKRIISVTSRRLSGCSSTSLRKSGMRSV